MSLYTNRMELAVATNYCYPCSRAGRADSCVFYGRLVYGADSRVLKISPRKTVTHSFHLSNYCSMIRPFSELAGFKELPA